jgi:hypothetical protein
MKINETNHIVYDLDIMRIYFQYDNLLKKIIRLQKEQSVLDYISMTLSIISKKAKYKEIIIDFFNLYKEEFLEKYTNDGEPYVFIGWDDLIYYPKIEKIIQDAILIIDPDFVFTNDEYMISGKVSKKKET